MVNTQPVKQPRKIALINVADYPRDLFNAYWEISVDGNDEDGYHWHAKLISYKPIAWDFDGNRTDERPDVPEPRYPEAPQIRQAEYVRMSAEQQANVRAIQDAYRKRCAEIYEEHPKPVTLIDEAVGFAEVRDDADTAAQTWVLSKIEDRRIPS
jgi:hypothetical protein